MRYEFLERKVMRGDIYRRVVDTIVQVLQKVADKRVSFMVYGSMLDDRLMPGLSDIDMLFFFWDKFVIDRALMKEIGCAMREQMSQIRFDLGWFLDVSVIDYGNARDGRFIPINDNFSKIFDMKGGDSELRFGKGFSDLLTPMVLVDPIEARLGFNLQALRSHLMFGYCNARYADGVNPGRELKILQQVRSVARKTMQIVQPANIQLAKDKKESLKALQAFFPSVDHGPIVRIEKLFCNRNRLINILVGATETHEILLDALRWYESVLREIVQHLPAHSIKKEA